MPDAASLRVWLEDVLRHGAGRNDAILLRHAHRAAGDADGACRDLRTGARRPARARERRAETVGQGNAFAPRGRSLGCRRRCASSAHAWATFPTRSRSARWPARTASPRTTRPLGLLQAFAANLISAAVRLMPLGQSAGLSVLAGAGAHAARGRGRNARRRRWTISAAPASAPTSPRCGTKRNIRGCSDHERKRRQRSAARRRRRAGGHRQDRADGRAVQARSATRYDIAAITNDIYTKEDAEFLTRAGSLPPERILGIETGGCPHTAIREDASINLAGVADLRRRFPRARRDPDRERRRQPRRHVQPGTRRPHDLRDRRVGRRQDPAQGRAGHHAQRPAGDQQDRPGTPSSAPTWR